MPCARELPAEVAAEDVCVIMAVNGEVQLSKTQSPTLLWQVEDGPESDLTGIFRLVHSTCLVLRAGLGLLWNCSWIECCEYAVTAKPVKVRSACVRHAESGAASISARQDSAIL